MLGGICEVRCVARCMVRCYAVQCDAVSRGAVPCGAVRCTRVVQCVEVQCGVDAPCGAWCGPVRCCTVRGGVTRRFVLRAVWCEVHARCGAVPHGTVLCFAVMCCAVWCDYPFRSHTGDYNEDTKQIKNTAFSSFERRKTQELRWRAFTLRGAFFAVARSHSRE